MDVDRYFMNMAFEAARASTCLRRNYGVVIAKDWSVVASGYNGAIRSEPSCVELGKCARDTLREKNGEAYNVCKGIHGEMRAIISAGKHGCEGATLYVAAISPQTGKPFEALPCELCYRIIKESGLAKVVGNTNTGEIKCIY